MDISKKVNVDNFKDFISDLINFKSSKNKALLIYYYILALLICSIIRVDIIQNIVMIFASFLLIQILYNKYELKDEKFKKICIIILGINIMLIFIGYFSSINLGFEDGLVKGKIGEFIYNDTYNYYYGSESLVKLWKNKFLFWITGQASKSEFFYGYYNFYVIINGLIRLVFGANLNLMILLKLQFSIFSMFLFYKIAIQFLNTKYTYLAFIVASVFPGYLLVNISLMRDSFILFFILYAVYLIVENEKKLHKDILIKFVITIIIVTYMRIYIGITLTIGLIFYYFINRIKGIKIRELKGAAISLLVVVVIVGIIAQIMGYGFLGLDLIMNASSMLPRFDHTKVSSMPGIIFWSVYHMFMGGRGVYDYSGYIGNFLNSTSNVFVMAISTATLSVFMIKKERIDDRFKRFVIFSFIYSLISVFVIVFAYSSIVPRLYMAWIWCQVIVFFGIIQRVEKEDLLYKIFKYGYPVYLIFTIFFILKFK